MFQGDIGDDRHLGVEDVGGIEPAPHPYFHNRVVHLAANKVHEGKDGRDLEKSRVRGARCEVRGLPPRKRGCGEEIGDDMTKFLDEGGDVGPRDGLTVYLDPLRELQEMRGGIEPDPIAGSPKDLREKCGGRPFAVGPADQDGRKPTVWISNCPKKPLDILETQLHAVTLEPVEISNRLGIGHTLIMSKDDFRYTYQSGEPG